MYWRWQVRFVEWAAEGRLRHAAFLGLRDDKTCVTTAPDDVVHQIAAIMVATGHPRGSLQSMVNFGRHDKFESTKRDLRLSALPDHL
jgi:hypothetical protein